MQATVYSLKKRFSEVPEYALSFHKYINFVFFFSPHTHSYYTLSLSRSHSHTHTYEQPDTETHCVK